MSSIEIFNSKTLKRLNQSELPAATMAQLPQELIVEIMLWLPVKSLKRFRCVSKWLCAVFDSPDFINSHLNRSSQNFNLRKTLFPEISLLRFYAFDVNVDLGEEEEEVVRTGRPVSTMTGRIYGGNCNGLLLFCQSVRCPFWFVLWNPSTRQFIELPDIPCEYPANVHSFILNGSGLGFDDSTDDYKAVLSIYVEQERDFEEVEVQFWIYSSRSSLWRRAQNFPYHLDAVFDEKIGYFTDGSLHWICALENGNANDNHFVGRRKEIVAFDVRKETFSLVPQPLICSINSSVDSVYLKLHLLEDSLCISYFYSSKPVVVDLFIRKKDGANQFSWTKLFSVTEPLSFNIHFFRFMNVLRYSKRGDKILLDVGRKIFMVSYDLRKKSFRKVKVEIHRGSHCQSPVVCLESLVWRGA